MMYRKTALAVDDTWNGSSGAAVASLGHGPIAVEHQRLGGGLCLNHQRLKLNGFLKKSLSSDDEICTFNNYII